MALTDFEDNFEVIWDGRGLLDPRDWPPQRPQVALTFEPTTDGPSSRRTSVMKTCRACGQPFAAFKHAAQLYCTRSCYHRTGRAPGGRTWARRAMKGQA